MPGCVHDGSRPVQVGKHNIFPGGSHYMRVASLFSGFDLIVPLDVGYQEVIPYTSLVIPGLITDFQPPSAGYEWFLKDTIIPELQRDGKVLVFCLGGHGRTGTVLAGLIALLEPDVDDPVAEVRNRYCDRAVETREQAEWIFALKGQGLPSAYSSMMSVPPRDRVRL